MLEYQGLMNKQWQQKQEFHPQNTNNTVAGRDCIFRYEIEMLFAGSNCPQAHSILKEGSLILVCIGIPSFIVWFQIQRIDDRVSDLDHENAASVVLQKQSTQGFPQR